MEQALFCDLSRFTKEELEIHRYRTKELLSIRPVSKLECVDGFEFTYESSKELLQELSQYLHYEQLCCPWAKFNLFLDHSEGRAVVKLKIIASGEAKLVLKSAIEDLLTGKKSCC